MPGVEPLALGREDHGAHVLAPAELVEGVTDAPGVAHGERVHGRVVHGHHGDAAVVDGWS